MRAEQEGLTTEEVSALVTIAPLDQWHLQWDENRREWLTTVTCPMCGEHLRYEVGALAEFYCSVCDYDWLDEAERLHPHPARL